MLGNWLVPVGDYFQTIQASPEVLHSYRSNTTILSGKASWTPDAPIPGLGFKYHPYQGAPVSFLLRPQFTAAYSRVLEDGGDPTLSATKDYTRLGSKVTAAWFVETGPLKGLSYSATYNYLRIFSIASLKSFSRLETGLSYTMPGQEFWAWELKYFEGRELDTFEKVKQLTLGVGLKY